MPYVIKGGKAVRVNVVHRHGGSVEITRTVGNHPEVITATEYEVFLCPECGKEYKTEAGLERHQADKH